MSKLALDNQNRIQMKKRDHILLIGLHVLAWILFVGLCVEAGGLLVNFFFNWLKPEMVDKLYQKVDLNLLLRADKVAFFTLYTFLLTIAVLKAQMMYAVISLLYRLDLAKPFNAFVAGKLMHISYYTLAIGLLSLLGRQISQKMLQYGLIAEKVKPFWSDGQAFILMGAVLYIIAVIFKRGVVLQNENDLTV
jgi:hypothetical protein